MKYKEILVIVLIALSVSASLMSFKKTISNSQTRTSILNLIEPIVYNNKRDQALPQSISVYFIDNESSRKNITKLDEKLHDHYLKSELRIAGNEADKFEIIKS